MDEFSVRAAVRGTTVVAAVTGEIDLAAAERLWTAVSPLIQPGRDVVLDCSGIRFLDSTGLRTLLDLDRRTAELGGGLVLAAVSRPVARVLDLAGVADVFTIRDTAPDLGPDLGLL